MQSIEKMKESTNMNGYLSSRCQFNNVFFFYKTFQNNRIKSCLFYDKVIMLKKYLIICYNIYDNYNKGEMK